MTDQFRVAVVGLGKIGLPLAARYANNGATVIGCDANPTVVDAVNRGHCPIVGEPGLDKAVSQAWESGRLSATSDTSAAVRKSNVVVLIVPVGLTASNETDYRHLDAAARSAGLGLKPGDLVILETTVPAGVTRNRLLPALTAASGLKAGDFRLAYSPERVSSGTIFRDLTNYPKIIGGIDQASSEAAAVFYRDVLKSETLLLPNPETAEFAKLAESVYRDVNIALANELAQTADALGIDYAQAARASNSQPHSHLHTPGLGVGGHCIPVYPYFLIENHPQRLVALGREVNDSMASYAVGRLEEALGREGVPGLTGQRVLILGLSYRGDVKEAALSSTLLVVKALESRGAMPLVHDPLYSAEEMAALGLQASALPPDQPVAAVILQAAHSQYAQLDLTQITGARVFLDGRGAFSPDQVEAAGMRYLAIGSGRQGPADV